MLAGWSEELYIDRHVLRYVAFINALLWIAALSTNTDGDTWKLGGGGHKHGSTLLWQSGLAA